MKEEKKKEEEEEEKEKEKEKEKQGGGGGGEEYNHFRLYLPVATGISKKQFVTSNYRTEKTLEKARKSLSEAWSIKN